MQYQDWPLLKDLPRNHFYSKLWSDQKLSFHNDYLDISDIVFTTIKVPNKHRSSCSSYGPRTLQKPLSWLRKTFFAENNKNILCRTHSKQTNQQNLRLWVYSTLFLVVTLPHQRCKLFWQDPYKISEKNSIRGRP